MEPSDLRAHDLRAVTTGLPELEFHKLADFNDGHTGVFRSGPGTSPWELHPACEELLLAIEGTVDIVVLTDDGPARTELRAGSMLVVPRGHWHRHEVGEHLVEMYLTPGPSEVSMAEDPRVA